MEALERARNEKLHHTDGTDSVRRMAEGIAAAAAAGRRQKVGDVSTDGDCGVKIDFSQVLSFTCFPHPAFNSNYFGKTFAGGCVSSNGGDSEAARW